MESVKFNYKAIELVRPGLVAVGRGTWVGYGGDRDARYLFGPVLCVCMYVCAQAGFILLCRMPVK